MIRDYLRDFVATLHEPAVVTSTDGKFETMNDAFHNLLREAGREDAERMQDVAGDDVSRLEALLASAAQTRPAIQGSLRLASGGTNERMTCYGGLLYTSEEPGERFLLLRFYRSQESVRRFRILGRKIEELNAEIRRRREAEAELREIRRSLEERVAERTADLERVNRDLARSNESLEQFAYVASHDLREPVRKVTVFSEMLRDEAASDLSEEHRHMLDRLFDAAARMDRLIRSLLEYSRASTAQPSFERVDLNRILREVLSDLEVAVSQTRAEIEAVDLPGVWADEVQMRQLFQNLISNGLKFRRPDTAPHIEITASRDPDDRDARYLIEVSDNGIGFDAKFARDIFDPFRRLNPQEQFEGTGIGLAVCRRIVERHGGTISAEGSPGEGATFRFTLPSAGDPVAGTSGPVSPSWI